jgi:hypothetical protein
MTTLTPAARRTGFVPALILIYAALFATVYVMHEEGRHFGRLFVETWQLPLHRDILAHRAGNPWQYRVLVPYMQEAVIRGLQQLGAAYEDAAYLVFMGTRYVQTFILFVLVGRYYRRLGLSTPGALLGMLFILWAFPYSYFEGNQSFNTYNDVIFYLLAALAILYRKPAAILPITAVAALNRETCGLIPVMLLFVGITLRPRIRVDRHILAIAIGALAIYAAIFTGLRQLFPSQPLLIPFNSKPGIALLNWNIHRPQTWDLLFRTLGYVPLLGLLWVRRLPRVLQAFFWAIVPTWFAIHFVGSSVVETRLFFVPYIVVLIPGVLLIARADRPSDRPIQPDGVDAPPV